MPDPPHRERPASMSAFRGMFCLVLFLVPVGLCLVAPAFLGHKYSRQTSNRVKCSNNLRQLGLAAIVYGDDKRFFPHVGPIKERDGGYDTNDTPKTFRALNYYGYHDNPEGWICPSSFDLSVPVSGVREEPGYWFWSGRVSDADVSPFVDGASDPTLRETSEVSYGWTRRGLSANVPSTTMLGADRAVRTRSWKADDLSMPDGELGNHTGALNVLRTDATVEYFSTGRSADSGFVEATRDLNLFRPSLLAKSAVGQERSIQVPGWLPGAAGLAGVLGLLGWLYHMGWRREWTGPGVGPIRAKRKRWLTADVDGVGKVELGGEQVVNAAGKPRVTLSPTQRCPFCHDPLVESDDLVACVACQTLLHRECVQEGGVCSTLGCTNQKK